jgi:hypothetical protein
MAKHGEDQHTAQSDQQTEPEPNSGQALHAHEQDDQQADDNGAGVGAEHDVPALGLGGAYHGEVSDCSAVDDFPGVDVAVDCYFCFWFSRDAVTTVLLGLDRCVAEFVVYVQGFSVWMV